MSDPAAHTTVAFADLPGWGDDDHRPALAAFLATFASLKPSAVYPGAMLEPLGRSAVDAWHAEDGPIVRQAARQFFERYFEPHRIGSGGLQGFVTGYYEPELKGARTWSPEYPVPLYKRPPDLINVVSEADRGAAIVPYTHLRRTVTGVEPYATRADIELGALSGQALELVFLADPVEAFFLQVQGSGLVQFDDDTSLRVTYDGKNGHPYTSIGKVLIERGLFSAQAMTLDALGEWLRANPGQATEVMRENKSFVFFRALSGAEAQAPQGVLGAPLTEGRSLAVDPAFHQLGLPIFLHAPSLPDDNGAPPTKPAFNRLMIAQDVGSAIKGPGRGDIFFGSGPAAGARAGVTKHACTFFALLPKRAAP